MTASHSPRCALPRLRQFVILIGLFALVACADNRLYGLSSAPPPEPQVEDVVRPDDPQAQVWRPGYWAYNGETFSWVPGTLIPRPSPTAVWSPDHWVEHQYGWAFEAGHWL